MGWIEGILPEALESRTLPDHPSCYVFVTERMREMDWHPNADERSYLEAKTRMTVFDATSTARTFDYERWGNRKHRLGNRPIAQRLQQSQVQHQGAL